MPYIPQPSGHQNVADTFKSDGKFKPPGYMASPHLGSSQILGLATTTEAMGASAARVSSLVLLVL